MAEVREVRITADAYFVCLLHALSNERQEIMGLLLGEVDGEVSHISEVKILQRSDKRPDRVEISPEQLSVVSSQAESLSKELDRPIRVVGWYHSHPHITVWPSHVDVHTQRQYQMLDPGFVGLIFSVFIHDKKTKMDKIEVTCFQSEEIGAGNWVRREVDLVVEPRVSLSSFCLRQLVQLPRILTDEELSGFQQASAELQKNGSQLFTNVHNQAALEDSLCTLNECVSGPLAQLLESRLAAAQLRLQSLRKRRDELKEQLRLASS